MIRLKKLCQSKSCRTKSFLFVRGHTEPNVLAAFQQLKRHSVCTSCALSCCCQVKDIHKLYRKLKIGDKLAGCARHTTNNHLSTLSGVNGATTNFSDFKCFSLYNGKHFFRAVLWHVSFYMKRITFLFCSLKSLSLVHSFPFRCTHIKPPQFSIFCILNSLPRTCDVWVD